MFTAYMYALYRDKNRQTRFEFMSGDSPAVIPIGTIVPDGAIVPNGAVIPDGTVLPTGAVIPPQTVVPVGVQFVGQVYNPQRDQLDPNTVKIPLGAIIPRGTVIPPNAYIPLNTYIPEGQRINVPSQAVIPKGAVIPEGTLVPNGSVVALNTVIPKNENTSIEIPNGTIIPSGSTFPKGTFIPKPLQSSVEINTAELLRSEYEKVHKTSSDLVIGSGNLLIPAGKKICIPTGTVFPDNLSGLVIADGTSIPKTNSINIPKGTFIPNAMPVEPLEWNASLLKRCAQMFKPMSAWDWVIFILDIIILYYAISIALCASPHSGTVAMHLIFALFFAPLYVLYHILFNTEAYQRYKNQSYGLSEQVDFFPRETSSRKKYLVSRKRGAYE
jgi:carbonic anhydrase/acetyltransferase-like protein (isoleucine patch superfamily)